MFGDGTNAFNLVIGANDTLSCDSMFVQNNITLTNSGTLLCTKLGAAIVYNITGLPVLTVAKDGWVNIEHLKSGLYFVKSEQKTIRLVVE